MENEANVTRNKIEGDEEKKLASNTYLMRLVINNHMHTQTHRETHQGEPIKCGHTCVQSTATLAKKKIHL